MLSEIAPSFGVFDLPFAFRDLYAVERFQALAVVTLAQDLRSEGLHALGFWHERMKQMTGKIPLVVPQNAAGLKFRDDGRTPPGLFNSLKATAKPVAENDLLNALKTGQVEAQVTAWDSLAEDKTVTVQAGATETNHGFEGYQLLAASAWWDKLDPASAKTLLEIINRINRQSNFDTVQRQTNAKRAVMRSGAAVLALTWEHRASWRLAVQPVWNEFANQTLLDMVAKADQAL